jgi:hypothetical protein
MKARIDLMQGVPCILPKNPRKREVLFYLPVLPLVNFFAGGFHFKEIIPVPKEQHEAILDRWRDGCLETLETFYEQKNRSRRPYKKLVLQLLTAYLLDDPLHKDLEPLVRTYTHQKFMGRRLAVFQGNIEDGFALHNLLSERYADAIEAMTRLVSQVPYLSNREVDFESRTYRDHTGFVCWKVVAIHQDGSERLVKTGFTTLEAAEAHIEHVKDTYSRGIIKSSKR